MAATNSFSYTKSHCCTSLFLASTCCIQYIRTYVSILHILNTYVRTYTPESMREPGPAFKSFQENMKSPQLRTNQKYSSLCNQLQSTMYACMYVCTNTHSCTYASYLENSVNSENSIEPQFWNGIQDVCWKYCHDINLREGRCVCPQQEQHFLLLVYT